MPENNVGVNMKNPSKTAETIAMVRMSESKKPEDERVCYDPYAIHFISREVLDFAVHNPKKYKAFVARNERLVPGASNSIVARVRFFDDIVNSSINDGIEQLVILGAGYDTRAYRIEGLDKVKVFEIDHPATQSIKIEKITEIFGSLPDYVTYIPMDIELDKFSHQLLESGYNKSLKTLFIMEGLLMYLSHEIVDEILSFIVYNSGKGSAIIFDYIPLSVVDGTCKLEEGQNWRNGVMAVGEPFLFGINNGEIQSFLVQRGFKNVRNITSEDYKKAYFHGKNKDRTVNSLSSFVHAVIE
ncbi:class I SAM-dependent methyltransferase [Methanobacterium sp.]|jgi:methyltransferase (TIGR00027 family)|uniref:class I SAM-dependent methyltransferase n=1 Tax=Methanobacterium sp. TaxID=2164 RepID=UPI003158EBFC